MFQNEKVDIRIKYTRDWTYQALEKILKTKNFEDIKISEIIIKAGISRATFYRNFSNKNDIITYRIKRFFDEFYQEVINFYSISHPSGELPLIEMFFNEVFKERDLIDTVHKSNLDYIMIENIVVLINNHRELFYKIVRPDITLENYIIEIVASSAWTLIKTWIKGGRKETPFELSKIYLATFKSVNIALFGNKDDLNISRWHNA